MRAFLITLLLLLSPATQAAEVVFMVNMNYSSNELKALKEVAKGRGQRVVMVPPESLIPEAEELFAKRTELEKKVQKLRPNLSASEARVQVADYMRKGLASTRDEELNQYLANEAEELHQRSLRLSEKERKLGSIEDQIANKAKELESQGDKIDSLVFSAHSDGSNLSGETSNRLSSSDITRLHNDHPELFDNPRHVLLLGCYNMTDTNHFRWRHELFRNASLIAGFGVRAPSRYRKESADYIRQVLGTADQLDSKMAGQGSPLDKGYVQKVFKSLAAVTGTQSVIEYCLQIIEGQPGSRSLSCKEQWVTFLAQVKMIKADYLDLRNMQKDPPHDDSNSELRTFYNTLQGTCPAKDAPQIPRDQWQKAERFRTSIRESLIRLIYWWNVQKNFRTYFAHDLDELGQILDTMGINDGLPALDGNTGRVEFVQRYSQLRKKLKAYEADIENDRARLSGSNNYQARRDLEKREKLLSAALARFKYFYPLYALEGEDTVGDEDRTGAASTLSRGGIPFHWIEPGAVLQSRRTK
jgi:hypothetical protein